MGEQTLTIIGFPNRFQILRPITRLTFLLKSVCVLHRNTFFPWKQKVVKLSNWRYMQLIRQKKWAMRPPSTLTGAKHFSSPSRTDIFPVSGRSRSTQLIDDRGQMRSSSGIELSWLPPPRMKLRRGWLLVY